MGLSPQVVSLPDRRFRANSGGKTKAKRQNWGVVATPQLTKFETTGSVYLLATLDKTKRRLVATHYATCVRPGGRNPLWAVFTITGRAPQFYHGKKEIAEDFSGHLWKRVAIRKQAVGLEGIKDTVKREFELRAKTKARD